MNINKTLTKKFAGYLFPSVASLVSLSLYILADTFFVANGVGSLGLAGLNIALPAYNLVNAVAMMCGTGAGVIISISRGSGDGERAGGAFRSAVSLAVIAGVVFAAVGVPFAPGLARLLGASGESVGYATTYLRVILAYSVIFTLNTTLCAIVRNDGNPRLAMNSMMANSFLNILLDYLFVMVFHWGMFGAAIATGMSAFCGILVLSLHWIKGDTSLRWHKKGPGLREMAAVAKNGISSFIVELGNGLVILVFNITLAGLGGDLAVAAYGIVANISLVVSYLFVGVGQGLQPLVGESYGKGELSTCRTYLSLALLFAMPVGALFFLTGQLMPGTLAALFNGAGDAALQETTVRAIRIYFIAFLFMGVNSAGSAYLQSMQRVRPATTVSLLRTCIMVFLGIAILPGLFGMDGVWMVIPLAEATALLAVVLSLAVARKQGTAIPSAATE